MLTIEKLEGVMSSGQNLQGGQEARFSVKNFAEGGSLPRRCYFCPDFDCILELKAGSVTQNFSTNHKWDKLPCQFSTPSPVETGPGMCVRLCTFIASVARAVVRWISIPARCPSPAAVAASPAVYKGDGH